MAVANFVGIASLVLTRLLLVKSPRRSWRAEALGFTVGYFLYLPATLALAFLTIFLGASSTLAYYLLITTIVLVAGVLSGYVWGKVMR